MDRTRASIANPGYGWAKLSPEHGIQGYIWNRFFKKHFGAQTVPKHFLNVFGRRRRPGRNHSNGRGSMWWFFSRHPATIGRDPAQTLSAVPRWPCQRSRKRKTRRLQRATDSRRWPRLENIVKSRTRAGRFCLCAGTSARTRGTGKCATIANLTIAKGGLPH